MADAELSVVDVIDEGDRVAHVLAGESTGVAPGARVIGRVDWARRFVHMQQHTGQHLVSALFQEVFGLTTLGVHFGAESSTVDLDTGALTLEQIRRVEVLANETVCENRAVTTEAKDAGAAQVLRKASARVGPLRVVSTAGLDRRACGGTHVRQTGELGALLLRKQERVRKATRVELVCEGRATARADYEALAGLGASLRGLAQAYVALPKAVLVAATEVPPSILLATSEDSGVDAGALLKAALTRAGGRGGGSARLAQGTVEGTPALTSLLETLRLSSG